MAETKLIDWTIRYVQNRDIMHKNIIDHEVNGNTIVFNFKTGQKKYFVSPVLNEDLFTFFNESGQKFIVCEASKDNLNFLINNWKKFYSITDLNLMFVKLSNDRKWLINPHVHHKICDDESLVMGLQSMFSNAFQAQNS